MDDACPQPGSCCAPNGTCTALLQQSCLVGNTWSGAGTACGAPCPAGACCLPNGSCVLLTQTNCVAQSGFQSGDSTACPGVPCFPDAGANNSKTEATTFGVISLASGNMIRGRSTGNSATAGSTADNTVDFFRIRTTAAAPGIYRHRLLLDSSVAGHAGSIMGLTQTAAGAAVWPGAVGVATTTDAVAQGSLTVGTTRINTWYGFGKQEEIYYRIIGGANTTAFYSVVMEDTPVVPTDLGAFSSGTIVLTTVGVALFAADNAVRIFDSNYNPIPGYSNDEGSTNGGASGNQLANAHLRRTFAPGTYYLALTIGDVVTNQGAPCDDNTRTGVMLDFPNAAVCNDGGSQTDCSFSMNDGAGPRTTLVSRTNLREILWYSFTVAGAVPTGACCAPDGVCTIVPFGDCLLLTTSTYQGNGSVCMPSPCPMGGCCLADATCSLNFPVQCAAAGGLHLGDATTCPVLSCLVEVEPNTSKNEANTITLANGQAIHGRTTGGVSTVNSTALDSLDYFRIQTPAASLGIYQHILTLDNTTSGNTTFIRGVNQTATNAMAWPGSVGLAAITENNGQASLTVGASRVSVWYGFGRGEEVYFRVSGSTATPNAYTATLQSTPITPTPIGNYAAGDITINTGGQGHTNDTSLRIYDSEFHPIDGSYNDDANQAFGGAPANASTSFLKRTYATGTYYIAITIGDLATDQGTPCDDNSRNGPMADFANVAFSVGTSTENNVSFSITAGAAAPIVITAVRAGAIKVAWFSFTVGASGVCCRGSTCNASVAQANCTASGAAGASFIGASSACNSGGSSTAPCCYADYNKTDGVSVSDIFAFLTDWFGASPNAIPGGDGSPATPTVSNIFSFLTAWFAGGC